MHTVAELLLDTYKAVCRADVNPDIVLDNPCTSICSPDAVDLLPDPFELTFGDLIPVDHSSDSASFSSTL